MHTIESSKLGWKTGVSMRHCGARLGYPRVKFTSSTCESRSRISPDQRRRQSLGRARVVAGEGETPAAANALNEPASLGDDRRRSPRGAIILRTKSPVE